MKRTYVIHCKDCKRLILKEDRDGDCPKETPPKKIEVSSTDYGAYERKRFPYFDDSLDMRIESKQHKREVLKDKGLIQHDGFYSRKKAKRGVFYSFPSKK
jgi:hypothetical protein